MLPDVLMGCVFPLQMGELVHNCKYCRQGSKLNKNQWPAYIIGVICTYLSIKTILTVIMVNIVCNCNMEHM